MYPFFRSLLFKLDPERAHGLTLSMIRLVGVLPPARLYLHARYRPPEKPVKVFGLSFSNPVGLAAGYDKDGLSWQGLASLGFGHIEVGTVTPLPQEGNPRPRLFRLPEERALINRMGFPGKGGEFVARRLRGKRPEGLVLGVNIGKNKDTPLDSASEDYLRLLRIFTPLSDYLTVNVSSPNTVGLRRLQSREALQILLNALAKERLLLVRHLGKDVPLLVKLAPDLTNDELDDALAVITATGMDGVVAANTTVAREGLYSPYASQAGGLSGAPLHNRNVMMVRQIYERTQGLLPIIGVGGVESAASAQEFLDAGAVLVQVYTGLIYHGPGLIKQIIEEISLRT